MDNLKVDIPFHPHPVTPVKMESEKCGWCKYSYSGVTDGYKCDVCNITFHANCKWPETITHPSHSLHPLKLFEGKPPAYTDGKCRLTGKNLIEHYSKMFYHCSACNFSLHITCIFGTPKNTHVDPNIHDHQLTLFPKSIFFTCTICGLHGDRSPYVCIPCDFIMHNGCSEFTSRMRVTKLPRVININRHDHRVSRTSLIGVVDSICGICRKKMNWSCGGFSCKKCPSSAFHTKCATRDDVWDGKERKDEPEEDEDVPPFKVIDENTIQHVSHPEKEHSLRLDKSGIFIEEKFCQACAYPIYHHSFYSCIICSFILHETCAYLPLSKRHPLSSGRSKYIYDQGNAFECSACRLVSIGFRYLFQEVAPDGFIYKKVGYDVRCASVADPLVHKSHPHPLYYTSPNGVCSVCNEEAEHVLRCIEDNCRYVMDYKCALLPYEVKRRVDKDILSLCYGEEEKEARGKYWCDICEKETDPRKWYYTTKDGELTLHTHCVLGDVQGLKPGIIEPIHSNFEPVSGDEINLMVVRNNSMSRPICERCNSRCIFPVFIRVQIGNFVHYACSVTCMKRIYLDDDEDDEDDDDDDDDDYDPFVDHSRVDRHSITIPVSAEAKKKARRKARKKGRWGPNFFS